MVTCFKHVHVNIVHANLLQLLPLPKALSTLSYLKLTTHNKCTINKPHRKRIQNTSDIFDSEESGDDEFLTLKQKCQDVDGTEGTEMAQIHDNKQEKATLEPINKGCEKLLSTALDNLSSIYDTLSLLDVTLNYPDLIQEGKCRNVHNSWSFATMNAGDLDHVTNNDDSDWWKHNYAKEMAATLEVLQLRQAGDSLQTLVKQVEESKADFSPELCCELSLPVDSMAEQLRLVQEPSIQVRCVPTMYRLYSRLYNKMAITNDLLFTLRLVDHCLHTYPYVSTCTIEK